MPIEITWLDDEKTILVASFSGNWTVEEFIAAVDQHREMVTTQSDLVSCIVDASRSHGFPKDTNMMPHLNRLFKIPVRHVAIIRGSALTQAILNTFLAFNPKWKQLITFVRSHEDALQALAKYDPAVVQMIDQLSRTTHELSADQQAERKL